MDETLHTEPQAQRERLLERPFLRGFAIAAVVVVMLLALWVLFPSEYWRF